MIYGNNSLAFIGSIGPTEMILIAAVGLLIFGNRLPDVGKSLGRGIVEFKKGLREVKDEIDKSDSNNKNNSK